MDSPVFFISLKSNSDYSTIMIESCYKKYTFFRIYTNKCADQLHYKECTTTLSLIRSFKLLAIVCDCKGYLKFESDLVENPKDK